MTYIKNLDTTLKKLNADIVFGIFLRRGSEMEKTTSILMAVIAWSLIIFQMVITQMMFQSYMQNQIVHIGLVGGLLSLYNFSMTKSVGKKAFWLLVLASFAASTGYMWWNIDALELRIGFPEGADIYMGVLLLAGVLICTWAAWGKVFPIISGIALAYMLFGHYLPGPLHHTKISFESTISTISLGFGSGIFGNILGMIVEFGFLLVLFGSCLEIMGANAFFLEMGKLGSKVSKGGPGQTAVLGSALVGMASGSALANVMITGAFTIPTMKRFGYKPEIAAAIESAASTGSQIMPPVMGATAFLMAAFLGVPFPAVMIAAFVPAVLYFMAIAINVELVARKYNIQGISALVNMRMLLERAIVFIVPLILLTVMLLMQLSPGYTAFWCTLLVVAIGFSRKTTRPRMKDFFMGLANGAVQASKIAIVVAAVAVIAQVVVSTGLGTKLAQVIAMLSQGNLAITLFLAMALCIILGCGVPSSAAYALVAILVVPGIVKMGVDPFQIHFFCFYFAVISCITPPVAVASLGAANIAGSDYTRTGWEALKMAATGFLLPFLFVSNPALLLRGDGFMDTVIYIGAAALAVLAFSFCLWGYALKKANMEQRILAGAATAGFSLFIIQTQTWYLIAGAICLAGVFIWQKATAVQVIEAAEAETL